MALGVIDFYSPVAKGFAAGFFRGDFLLRAAGRRKKYKGKLTTNPFDLVRQAHHKLLKTGALTIKRNGVVLLRNDPAIYNRTGEFSVKPVLKIFESGGFCLLLCFILGYEGPAQYHFLE
jgi:hypothetical protein